MRASRWLGVACVTGGVCFATPALADKVVVLPFLAGSSATTSVDIEVAHGATRDATVAAAHTLATAQEVLTAQMSSKDGVVDTGEEYRAAGRASTSDWTVIGHVEEHGGTYRLELDVCQVGSGRVESLAREITPAEATHQISEMLALLLRPEGLGSTPIPWEPRTPPLAEASQAPKPPPAALPPEPPPAPPPPPAPRHPYAEGHPVALGVMVGALDAFSRPANASGSAASGLVGVTASYALPSVPGLELKGDLDWSVAGPGSVTVDAGVRYAFPLVPTASVFIGPEADVGAFFAFGADKTARALLQGAGFVAVGLGERVQVEAVGLLAYAAGSPSLSLGGGVLRGVVRF